MLHEQLSETWSSPNEFVVTERERRFIAELAATDERIGREVAAKYGRGTIAKRSIPVRIVRRVFFELKKFVGPAARKVQRFVLRQWNRRVTDRRRVPDGTIFEMNGRTFEVINLNSETARKPISEARSEFLILTREPNALLKSATQPIAATVSVSDESMWFGDSRNAYGARERRPVFTRLLLRQVDALGPVVIVRSDVMHTVATNDIAPNLLPLTLGLTLREESIELIPEVLGVGPVTVSELGEREPEAVALVEAELARSSLKATVTPMRLGRRNVEYQLASTPLVSIIIPTRGTAHDGGSYVVDAVRSIVQKSSYPNLELMIVADNPTPQHVVDEVDQIAGQFVRWVRWSEPFNFSNKMNLGAVCAEGEYLLVLNDDIEVVSADWVERMVSLLGVDGIGHAGALLFFGNQTIQHAGHLHRRGVGHVNIGEPIRLKDPSQILVLDQPRAGVTAACSVLTRELFFDIGGFSSEFPGNYNDVDLCCKVRDAGYLNAVSGHARLYHFESITRDAQVQKFELERLFSRWWRCLEHDEYSRGE